MHVLMNRYLGKISRMAFLSAPPDDTNMSGGGQQQQGGGDQQNQNNGNDDDGGGDDDLDPDSVTVDDLFKPPKGQKDSDEDFLEEDDSDDAYEPTEEQKAASAALGASIKQKIDSLVMAEADIPDDLDWSNKKAVAEFMGKTQRAAVQNALGMVPQILNHGLNLIIPRLEAKIQKAVGSQSKASGVKTEFDSLGYKGADRELAKTIYKRALGTFNNDPKKASAATRKAMNTLGKPPAGNGNGRGQSGDSGGSGMKTGAAALDAMFND